MRRSLIAVAWITAIGISPAGCKSHDQLVIDTVCPAVCRCDRPEFLTFEECVRTCKVEVDPAQVSQECFDCFLEEEDAACPLLLDRCRAACEIEDDEPPPPFVDAPIGVPI